MRVFRANSLLMDASWCALLLERLFLLLTAFLLRYLSGWICLPVPQDFISLFCSVFFISHCLSSIVRWAIIHDALSFHCGYCAPSPIWSQIPPCFLLEAQHIHVRIVCLLPVWQAFLDLLSLVFLLWLPRISNLFLPLQKKIVKYALL